MTASPPGLARGLTGEPPPRAGKLATAATAVLVLNQNSSRDTCPNLLALRVTGGQLQPYHGVVVCPRMGTDPSKDGLRRVSAAVV